MCVRVATEALGRADLLSGLVAIAIMRSTCRSGPSHRGSSVPDASCAGCSTAKGTETMPSRSPDMSSYLEDIGEPSPAVLSAAWAVLEEAIGPAATAISSAVDDVPGGRAGHRRALRRSRSQVGRRRVEATPPPTAHQRNWRRRRRHDHGRRRPGRAPRLPPLRQRYGCAGGWAGGGRELRLARSPAVSQETRQLPAGGGFGWRVRRL
jgi:hypothetical protein